MPSAHIFPLSRLVYSSPVSWERQLESIEEGKPFAFSYYLPMREAVVAYCAARGQGREQIVQNMIARARAAGGVRGPKVARANLEAFNTFEAVFLPQVARYRRNFLRGKHHSSEFEGLTIEGAPHFEVTDRRGKKRNVFLHAASWSSKELLAYLELLGIIVEEHYGGDSSSIWVLDLKHGREIKWRSSSRVRNRCRAAAKLYARIIGSMESPEEDM